MQHATTEFVFFVVSDDVKPEDPSNERGQELLKVFQAVKGQDGYVLSGWGRTEEDINAMIWITEWSIDNATMNVEGLASLTKRSPEMVKIRTVLQPSLSEVGGLQATPCIDVTTLTFKGNSTEQERATDLVAVQRMKRCVTQDVATDVQPRFYCLSRPDTFPEVASSESPSGKADLCVAVVGWTSRQQHYDMWKTEEFKALIPSVRERLLPYPPGVGMKHTTFNLV
ncbi:uncharacterized protein Z519_12172 [Cladophialophora bantiana CBS 173.52]|uniref:ABM domain-containing protein n=1 Tax=Cladophialophora bantiana (strain ATCC 10958 / CBS 173.52 / CDC B-1940 / NIH 8579) TaxID=1442370 RepID=A0A0D2HSB0_CLAB1|nr:uncharacterized protein Z519_12172 [Cladophialophora bantiana CBS 173.52]KIW87269.1 hypothetical protein Z519_12172 [Cladophialophora bantiana CBS 173.52]